MSHELDSKGEYFGGDPVFANPRELNILRSRVRVAFKKEMGGQLTDDEIKEIMTDYECDKIIAVTSVKVREEWLKAQIDGKR